MTANELSKRFLLWFQKVNPEAKIYRNNAGCFKTIAGNWVRYGIPNKGGADFIAFTPEKDYDCYLECSNMVDIESDMCLNECKKFKLYLGVQFYEIKTTKDKMSKDQIKFADMITGMGGDYFIVHESNTKQQIDLNEVGIKFNICTEWFYLKKWSLK